MNVSQMNREYWGDRGQRSIQAGIHTATMESNYKDQITYSFANSIVYDHNAPITLPKKDDSNQIQMEVLDMTSTDAIFYAKGLNSSSKVAVLNFASYKNPGGKFIDGSIAQEESLCHSSFLYNVLSNFDKTFYEYNRKHLNRSLYTNRAIYTPDVIFFKDDRSTACDVITCAAPNIGAASKYCRVSRSENQDVLLSRCRFILDIAKSNMVDTLILGAFGCGVFRQNPYTVADTFVSLLSIYDYNFKRVIFAVPNHGHGIENYKAFCNKVAGCY